MVLKMQIKFFEHDEHTSQLILFRISTNDGMTFCTLDFKFPLVWREKWKSFSLGYIGAEIDKCIPGVEICIRILGLQLFFRHNTAAAKEIFEQLEKDVEEAKETGDYSSFKTFDELKAELEKDDD